MPLAQEFLAAMDDFTAEAKAEFVATVRRIDQETRTRQPDDVVSAWVDGQPSNALRLTGSYTLNPYVENGVFPHNQISLGNLPPSANFGGSTGVLTGADLTTRQGGKQDANNVSANANWAPRGGFLGNLRVARGYLNERLSSKSIPMSRPST